MQWVHWKAGGRASAKVAWKDAPMDSRMAGAKAYWRAGSMASWTDALRAALTAYRKAAWKVWWTAVSKASQKVVEKASRRGGTK